MDALPIPVPTLGLIKSMSREQIPPEGLADCQNWIRRDRDFRVRPGLTVFGNNVVAGRPTGLIHYDHGDGSLRTVLATSIGWYRFDYGTRLWTLLTGTSLTSGIEQQVFRVIAQSGFTYLIGVNWKDAPKKWDGLTAGYSNIGGTPPIARTMLVLNNRVIMGNLRTGPNISPVAVDWSSFNNFDAGWGGQATLLADTPGEIVIGEEMGNSTGSLIKTDAAYRVIAQTGANPFRFDFVKVPKDSGAAATLGYCILGNGLMVYLGLNGKLKSFDLNTVSDFGGDNARVHLQETIDFSVIGRSWMAYDTANNEILVVYPSKGGSGEPDFGLIIKENGSIYPLRWATRDFAAGTYARISNPITIGSLTVPIGSIKKTLGELGMASVLRQILAGDTSGHTYYFTGDDDAGQPIDFEMETGLLPLGDGSKFKTVNNIEHRTNRTNISQLINVQIGTSKHGEDRTLSNPQTIDIASTAAKFTGHRVTSKYLSMRLSGSAVKPVVWKGSFVNAVQRGEWR